MALHPQAQQLVDAYAAMPQPSFTDETLAEQRLGFGLLLQLAGPPEEVASVTDADADGVPVRIYRPSNDDGLPIVCYFHGGGFTIGSVEQFDAVLRQVCNASGAIVVAPEYRLAPEHPFPAAIDDCWQTVQWVAKNASSFGGDSDRVAVMGDSAGGNLSAVAALMARDAGTPRLAAQVLVYPVADSDFTTASYVENADGYLLTRGQMQWFIECYTRGGVDRTDWRISPLRAVDLRDVAPAVVITAGYDPLRDEGDAYAQRLRDAGVPVVYERYDDMLHGFFGLSAAFDRSREAMQLVGTELRRAFGTLSR